MNILGIDTSTKKANVCLKKDNTFFDNSINNEITHSEKLLPLVDKTLKEANITLNEINYLACSIGPGSFTGIRIGLSTIKAFAKVISKPIFAVSSLDVLAYTNNDTSNYAISIMDAKNSRIYYAVYKIKYDVDNIPILDVILDYRNDVIDVALDNIYDALSKEIFDGNSSVRICGDCTDMYNNVFTEKLSPLFKKINIYTDYLSGKVLVTMLENYIKTGCVLPYTKDYLTLDAIYVRPSQAERAKKKMNYNIKKANITQLEEIYSLELEYEHLLLSKESLKNDLKDNNSIYIVATDFENKIVGVAGINILVDHADITMVLTKKSYQNLGIATLLLNDIIEKCKKLALDSIFLEVRKSNISAIKLYEKLGFEKISERKNYYKDSNENALIYILKIH